jgi:hypothetical protein
MQDSKQTQIESQRMEKIRKRFGLLLLIVFGAGLSLYFLLSVFPQTFKKPKRLSHDFPQKFSNFEEIKNKLKSKGLVLSTATSDPGIHEPPNMYLVARDTGFHNYSVEESFSKGEIPENTVKIIKLISLRDLDDKYQHNNIPKFAWGQFVFLGDINLLLEIIAKLSEE